MGEFVASPPQIKSLHNTFIIKRAMEIKNSELYNIMKWSKWVGLDKLMNHPSLDSDKAYEMSLLIPELQKQVWVIEENRNRISKKIFPMDEKTGEQNGILKTHDRSGKLMKGEVEATPEEVAEYSKKMEEFLAEFNKVLEKNIEISWDKIELSRKKDEKSGRSELQNLNLTVTDLMILAPLITVTK